MHFPCFDSVAVFLAELLRSEERKKDAQPFFSQCATSLHTLHIFFKIKCIHLQCFSSLIRFTDCQREEMWSLVLRIVYENSLCNTSLSMRAGSQHCFQNSAALKEQG